MQCLLFWRLSAEVIIVIDILSIILDKYEGNDNVDMIILFFLFI